MENRAHQQTRAPLWEADRVTEAVSTGVIYRTLDEAARRELDGLPDIREKVVGALQHPKPLDICLPVFNSVLAAQYCELFEALQPARDIAVYEPCVGASNPVLLAAEAYSRGRGRYVAMNLNRPLREQLRTKIAHLKMEVRIIEEDAQRALELLSSHSFDVACFHHAVNDILQTAVAEPRGMDTTKIDWFPSERQMIEWLAEDENAGRLDERGKPELIRIIAGAARLVRPGGWLIFDHWNWCKFIGVPWFPWELFYHLIPMTRRWIADSGLQLSEIRLEGVDPQWWMILQAGSGDLAPR